MNYELFKHAVVYAAQQKGLTDYELYYMGEESISVDTFQQEVNSFSSNMEGGVCFRCIVDGKMGYASTQLLDEEQAGIIVDRAMENARTIENTDEVFIHPAGDTYREVEKKEIPLLTAEEMIPFVLDCQKKAYAADSRVVDGTQSSCGAVRVETRLTNSKGLDLCNISSYQLAVTGVVLQQDGQMYNDYQFDTGRLEDMDKEKMIAKAIEQASATIGADIADSGKYPVVIDRETVASFLAIFSSVFSAEDAQNGMSLLKDKENTEIASPCVTLIDDPFYPGSPVQTSFDGEGVATFTKAIVENGVLKTLFHNLKTAAKDHVKSTGNAYKAGYASNVSVAPYSFYLKPGELSKEELFAKAGNGVYLTDVSGGHAGANPITGDFSLQSKGFLIENGKKGKAIRGFTVAGNFFELLKSITDVGSDLKFGLPGGSTCLGAPSVLVSELSIAGK